ncbi:MAG: hypothetical protein RL176_843, partial [Pseudomonadota bacterium]
MPSKKPNTTTKTSKTKRASDQGDLFAMVDERPPKKRTQVDEALSLGVYAERAYLDYAISVVKGRALPEVADGQKPV